MPDKAKTLTQRFEEISKRPVAGEGFNPGSRLMDGDLRRAYEKAKSSGEAQSSAPAIAEHKS